jgi:hypothetical protein
LREAALKSEADYYAAVEAIGLHPTRFPETYVTGNGEPHSVPSTKNMTPDQRQATFEKVKFWVEAERDRDRQA